MGHHSGYIWFQWYQAKLSKGRGRGDDKPESLVPGQKGGSKDVTTRKGLAGQGESLAELACTHSAWIFLKPHKGSRLRVDSMAGEYLPRS